MSITGAPDGPPFRLGVAIADIVSGMFAAQGITAALLARERTGRGQLVTTSLLRIGAYVLGWDLNATLRMGIRATPFTRTTMPNPVISPYRAGDGRWFWLLGLQGQRHWPDLVRAVERPEWLTDPRFATMPARRALCRGGAGDRAIFATARSPTGASASTAPACGGRRCGPPGRWPTQGAPRVFTRCRKPRASAPAVAQPLNLSNTPWAIAAPRPSADSTPRKCCWSWATTGRPSPRSGSRRDPVEDGRSWMSSRTSMLPQAQLIRSGQLSPRGAVAPPSNGSNGSIRS
jgi:crotonobetainyl-CoA:carnitine CoA-transferase CaiB-like acyl-CoA transferase